MGVLAQLSIERYVFCCRFEGRFYPNLQSPSKIRHASLPRTLHSLPIEQGDGLPLINGLSNCHPGFGKRGDQQNVYFNSMKCPRCESSAVYLSHSRNVFEKIIKFFLFLQYYRCHTCGWRGRRFEARKWGNIPKYLALLLSVVLVGSLLVIMVGSFLLLLVFR